MSSSRESQRPGDIIANARMAESYVDGISLDSFMADHMRINAVERCIERLIDASIKIGEDRMREIGPDVPFHELRGMGNRLRHSYDLIDAATVHNTACYEVPVLRAACEAALTKLSPSP